MGGGGEARGRVLSGGEDGEVGRRKVLGGGRQVRRLLGIRGGRKVWMCRRRWGEGGEARWRWG